MVVHKNRGKAAVQLGLHGDYKKFEFYEGTFTDKFVRACKNKVVVDCGMCYGYYSALALRAGAKHVFGFEPNVELHGEHLKQSFEQFHPDRITFCPRALGDKHEGTIKLATRPGTLRSWSATKEIVLARGNPKKTEVKMIEVPCTTIDYVAAGTKGPVGVIKCDTEGAEATLFHGATKVLEDKPAIFLELHRIGKPAIVELAKLLRSFGYTANFLDSPRSRFVLEAK